jgi:hypothetical protein
MHLWGGGTQKGKAFLDQAGCPAQLTHHHLALWHLPKAHDPARAEREKGDVHGMGVSVTVSVTHGDFSQGLYLSSPQLPLLLGYHHCPLSPYAGTVGAEEGYGCSSNHIVSPQHFSSCGSN